MVMPEVGLPSAIEESNVITKPLHSGSNLGVWGVTFFRILLSGRSTSSKDFEFSYC